MKSPILLVLCCLGCGDPPVLTVEMPLHLEDHLNAAVITGSELPANPPQPVEWRFDQPQPDWRAATPWNPTVAAAELSRTGEALRVTLTERSRNQNGFPVGGVHIDLPDWNRGDWADVVIRVRADSASSVRNVGLGFNPREGQRTATDFPYPFQFAGQNSPIVRDGTIQTYRLRVGRTQGARPWQGPWRRLGLWFSADREPGSVELLSVSVVPNGAVYAGAPHGVRPVPIAEHLRRTLYLHAPARVSYRLRVPEGGRLDTGLGVLRDDDSVTFRVRVGTGGDEKTLFEERYADPEEWAQRSVDLANFAGRTVTLTLETLAEQPGTVALWGAPTVSGTRSADKPNVIFYVIDGAGADQMSLYGYNRRTTPNLERLAGEGAVFEHAYSNSSWTKPSTLSFMTSLHNSVLGAPDRFEALPDEARTMAERFHDAGYSTAVFTTNPNAGTVSGLQRGVDVFRERGFRNNSWSSVDLHREFWEWRDASPGQPFWVHFQTTDVHTPNRAVAPFAGLFASPEAAAQLRQWDATMNQLTIEPFQWADAFAETGIDRIRYWDIWRSIYDETMAHQDYELGRFVERLKETGEWENTLLIVAADHSVTAASDDFLVMLEDSVPPDWQEPIFRSSISRVPLLFIWPGHIDGGRRFIEPVSMIDVLPTVLELAGLPQPEVLQGQSLAPLLLGQAGWLPRPVIFDEFDRDQANGEFEGRLEMIDGRWGASLWIGPLASSTGNLSMWSPASAIGPRPTPLLLFDVWSDPMALTVMNDAFPELVTKYTALLEAQWEAHRLLARRFTAGGQVELTPAQLETLRALGYIR